MARVCVFLVLGLVACATCSTITEQSDHVTLSTPQLEASFVRKGYVSGVKAGSFLDKATGARDLGFGLDIIDWPRGAAIRSAADVPAETLVNLGLMYGPFVAGFGIVSVLCYLPYSLTRQRHEEIMRMLEQRRQVESSTG